MNKLIRLAAPLVLLTLFLSHCSKKDPTADNCAQILQCRIAVTKATYVVGDTINLKTNLIPSLSEFIWSRGSASNQTWGDATVTIYNCTKNDEGWYYLNVSYPDCAYINDSVYISVTNNPVMPDCTPADNTVAFSSIPSITMGGNSFAYDDDFKCRILYGVAPGGDQDMNIYFNPYWDTVEPEDGAYTIYSLLDFSDAADKYAVYMLSHYSGIGFQASGGKVYVTHENQKLKVTFCNVSLIGDTYTTAATGSLLAP